MNPNITIWCVIFLLINSSWALSMSLERALATKGIPVTTLNNFPIYEDRWCPSELRDAFKRGGQRVPMCYSTVSWILEYGTAKHLENMLFYSGCPLFTLKHRIKSDSESLSYNPWLILWRRLSCPEDDWKWGSSYKNDSDKLDVLLKYGFHIPYNPSDLHEYEEWAIEIPQDIASDPRIFGGFYEMCEENKRREDGTHIPILFLMKKRTTNLISIIPRDVIRLISADLFYSPSSFLHRHCERLLKFHQRPFSPSCIRWGLNSRGRVQKWPIDITLDEIKEKIGPAVLKNYERLLAEWKDYHNKEALKKS